MALFSGSTFGRHRRQLPGELRAPPNLGQRTARGRLDLRWLRRGPARRPDHRPASGRVRAQARAVGRLHQRAWPVSRPFSSFPAALREPADGLLRDPEPVRRHARLRRRDRATPGCARTWAATRRWAMTHDSLLIVTWDEDDDTENQPDPDDLRRRAGEARQVRRDDQPLQRAGDDRGRVRRAAHRARGHRCADIRHLGEVASAAHRPDKIAAMRLAA